jgi:RHS repeat-associated protein
MRLVIDTETGLYYYGARYYNLATALWLGVDPLNNIQSKLFFVPPGEKKYVETNSPSLSHGIDYFIH